MINNRPYLPTDVSLTVQPVGGRVRCIFIIYIRLFQSIISIYGSMSRAAIKYQSYFISSQSRGRSTFGRLIFFSHRRLSPLPPLLRSLASFSFRPLSLISFCFVVIFARLISYNLHMVLRVNGVYVCVRARAYRNKVSIIPSHLSGPAKPTPLRSGMLRAAWRPGAFRLANMKSAGSLVTHFPNSRIVLHPRARTK